ncbi:MAG: PKD domain-containing protein, partial [Flavobacteriales bacterium]|nr:PKD domain-containing protein [Flavobacteriales bacterium]
MGLGSDRTPIHRPDPERVGGPGTFPLVAAFVLFFALGSKAQSFEIFNGTHYTCVGAFLDSGGQGGSGYGNNESYTCTICPDNPGDAISVDFITFNLSTAGTAPIDNLSVYDGDSPAAPLIGNYTGTSLQGQAVSASMGNPTGCLTFVWNSNASGTGIFAGSISCYVPCDRPIAAAIMGQAAPALICQGEAVNFDGSASTAAPGFSIATYNWDFGDGTVMNGGPPITSHPYPDAGGFEVQLQVIDNNGCSSANTTDLEVWVGTTPTFTGTDGDLIGCEGSTLCLDGIVGPVTWNELPEANFGDGVYLPDNVGSCFTSELTFSQFAPGQTLTNIAQLGTICMDIEHSFIGDLVISVTAPTGENVILHQQGGGGTFLGDANDLDNNINPVPGTCWTYCWSPTANNGDMATNALFGGNTVPSSQGTALAPGTYESVQPLAGLVGAQLNGIWTFEICDLWGADNGFLCEWSIAFDPTLYDDLTEFTPVYGADCDSSFWSGPFISQTSADCNSVCITPPAAGSYDYQYTVTDNFGCTYDTTLTITIVPDPDVDAGPDVTTCSDPVQLNATVSGGLNLDCNYVLEMEDSFGDGWNGGQVTIIIAGVPGTYTLNNGSTGQVVLPVTAGDPIQISYSTGLFNNEVSFYLLNGNGVPVFSVGPPSNGILWNGIADCNGINGGFTYLWSPATGLSDPTIPDPVATVPTTAQYCVTVVQAGFPECSATDCLTITVESDADAGSDASVLVCASDPVLDLFAQLGGTPDPGGTWTDPNSDPFGTTFDPNIDLSGTYTYTVTGSGNCGATAAQSTVTVTVQTLPNPGLGASIVLCTTDAAMDLFTLLGGTPDAGGGWTDPNGDAFGGLLDPASDPAGVYTYSVAGTAPCPSDAATVTVTINTPPDPGTDGSVALCTTDAAVDLFTLLGGTPDAGGGWTDPNGDAFGGLLDPASDPAGVYTYSVAGTAPCPS